MIRLLMAPECRRCRGGLCWWVRERAALQMPNGSASPAPVDENGQERSGKKGSVSDTGGGDEHGRQGDPAQRRGKGEHPACDAPSLGEVANRNRCGARGRTGGSVAAPSRRLRRFCPKAVCVIVPFRAVYLLRACQRRISQ